jgi:hypothetical protein
MRRPILLLAVAVLCLSGGCLADAPASEQTTSPASATNAPATTPNPEGTTSRVTRDPLVLDEIVEVEAESNRTHDVSVAVLNLTDDSTVRTVNRSLTPDAEFSLSRPIGAEHRRVVVRVDGTVVFDRTVYTAEQYWVTVHNTSSATVSKAVA